MIASNRRLLRFAIIVYLILDLIAARSARADSGQTRRLVVVLRPNPDSVETWPEGTQAVVAELVAGGYELMLRGSVARDRDGLLAELRGLTVQGSVLGAVVVVRDGDRGIAYVYTRRSGTVSVEAGISEGAVGEGALALRITQILGRPRLDVGMPSATGAEPPAPSPAPPPAPPQQAPSTVRGATPRPFLVAAAAGLGFMSDLPEPLPIMALSARRRLVGPLSIDLSGALTLGASQLETNAGDVEVSAEQLTLHVAFEPLRYAEAALSLGLGGGVVWMRGAGEPRAGFRGADDSTRVALFSAAAALSFNHDDWSVLLHVEPGVMLPAVSVGTGGNTARLGRPWTTTRVGLGWNF